MRESLGGKPKGAMKVKTGFRSVDMGYVHSCASHHSPVSMACHGAEVERIRKDPKDGELYVSRTKPEETPVEVRNDSDVQFDRLTGV